MPLSQATIDKLREAWRIETGELVSKEEAWDMATRLLCFLDAVQRLPVRSVDSAALRDRDAEVHDGDGG